MLPRRIQPCFAMPEIKTNLHLEIAHILFVDVVGYSKLLVNEQTELLEKLNAIVLQTAQVRAADAANQLIRLPTGDGMALVFRNHPEAPAECALEIAAALRQHPEIKVRMGVHSGPVNEVTDVNQRSNMAGAGVNVAQRVMACGDAGHILLSKRVADDLGQYREWQPLLHDLGEVEVKHGVKLVLVNLYRDDVGNPATPEKFRRLQQIQHRAARKRRTVLISVCVTIVLLLLAGVWWSAGRGKTASPATTAATPVSAKSIAVLPLENLSEEKENAFFADGIQDDVLTSLAKIKDLKVISRTSVMGYRDKAARNLKQIGKELGVASVLEGSVRRVGNRVLVNVQLIDTATDQHLWAERYDRTLADSITLQGELASEIAKALQSTLSPQEKARVEARPTENPEAYVAYLRGREVQLRPETSRENYLSAIDFYKQAVALDPKFVLARARLSFMQAILQSNFETTDKALLAEGRNNAEEALRLDDNSAEAHLAAARYALADEDDVATRRELEAVLRLNPNDATLTMQVAITQQNMGWIKEAAESYKRAAELGPREPKVFYNYAGLLHGLGRVDEARDAIDRALALAPESVFFRVFRVLNEIAWTGDIDRAKTILSQMPAGKDPDGRVTATRCYLAIIERNFPEGLRIVETYPGEKLPFVGNGGWGPQHSKRFSEGYLHWLPGEREAARKCLEPECASLEENVRNDPKDRAARFELGCLYAMLGRKDEAIAQVRAIEELQAKLRPEQKNTAGLSLIYAWVGELDQAWRLFNEALSGPYTLYANEFRLDPAWDPMRQDPRFQNFLATHKP